MAGSYGYNTRFSVMAAGGSFTGSSPRFPVVRYTISRAGEVYDHEGSTGTRSLYDALARDGDHIIAGQIEFHPTFNILDWFLPHILGGSESSDTFPIADTLPAFDAQVDLGGDIIKHSGIKVSKAELAFGPGLLRLTIDCLALSESFPASWSSATLGTNTATDAPYAFQDCTFSINSGTRRLRQGVLTIDNHCEAIFSSGSQTAEEIIPQQSRTVTLSGTAPSSSSEWSALYGTSDVVSTSVGTGSITISHNDGTNEAETVVSLRGMRSPKKTPVMDGKGEIFFVPVWQARHNGTQAEISITNTTGSV